MSYIELCFLFDGIVVCLQLQLKCRCFNFVRPTNEFGIDFILDFMQTTH